MSAREAAAVAMVQAGATRRAACDEHNVYPANLRRALKKVEPSLTAPRPDIDEWTLALHHAERARVLRAYARLLRMGGTIHGWKLSDAERFARVHEKAVREAAFFAERSATDSYGERAYRARRVKQRLQSLLLPCTAGVPA